MSGKSINKKSDRQSSRQSALKTPRGPSGKPGQVFLRQLDHPGKNVFRALTLAAIFITTAFMQVFLISCGPPAISFEDIVISEDVQLESNEPINPKNEFEITAKKIAATVKYSGVTGSDSWGFKWINMESNETILDSGQQFNEEQPQSYFNGTVSSDIFTSDEAKIIAPASYKVEFYYNGELTKTTTFRILKPDMAILEIVLSDEVDEFGAPSGPLKQFNLQDTVYASIKFNYLIAGNTIKAVWEISGGQLLSEAFLEIKDDYYEQSYIWFSFPTGNNKDDIAHGIYTVSIYVNEKLYESADFEFLKSSPPTFSSGTIYKNEQYGFEVAIPDKWSYEEKTDDGIFLMEFKPDIEIDATYIFTTIPAKPLKPYNEFTRSDAENIAGINNWALIEIKSREYLLKNTYQTFEFIYLYRDENNENCVVAYSITEHGGNACIYHTVIKDESYSEFSEVVYYGILNSLVLD